ncbi:MAG TPA: histidine kinase [Gaiellaceae bacterium]|nr:histidine kinase [Gaiellaceae bacterium]
MTVGRYGPIAIVPFAAAAGLFSVATARHDPVWAFAGASTLGGIAELGAAWALVGAGVLFWMRHRQNRLAPLLIGAGFAWLLPEWTDPQVGSALAFTVGLVGFVACAPLVAHAALAYPTGRLRTRVHVAVVATSYAGALLSLGLLPTTVFDPKAAGCFQCPQNLALIRGDLELFATFNRYGLWLGIGWLLVLCVLLVWRLVRTVHVAAVVAALVPAIVYVALVTWEFQHSLTRGILGNDSFDQRVWRSEAAALGAFALAVVWGLVRERQARATVARLVVELGEMPRPGAVRDALAQTLGDAELELAYRRPDTGHYVDGLGRVVNVRPGRDQAVTPLFRGGVPVAVLVHDARLSDEPGLLEEVLAAARIAVENEQLQAEIRAQLEDLRASRARIVETGDAERRRLERNLHDGAQQLLVALSYDLRIAQAHVEADVGSELTTLLTSAGETAQSALGELRELAHGIYPAILAEAGLEAALATLADEAPLPVELGGTTPERYSEPIESAAYRTVVEGIDDAAGRGATYVSVDVGREESRLIVTLRDDGADRTSPLVHLADRIGALGGSLEVGGTTLRAVVPCV